MATMLDRGQLGFSRHIEAVESKGPLAQLDILNICIVWINQNSKKVLLGCIL